MGQSFFAINLDKREMLNPHSFRDGYKLTELAFASCGLMSALAMLLAEGNGEGAGDLYTREYRKEHGRIENDLPIVGSWARNRIVILGEYCQDKELLTEAISEYNDISETILTALMENDDFVRIFNGKPRF